MKKAYHITILFFAVALTWATSVTNAPSGVGRGAVIRMKPSGRQVTKDEILRGRNDAEGEEIKKRMREASEKRRARIRKARAAISWGVDE